MGQSTGAPSRTAQAPTSDRPSRGISKPQGNGAPIRFAIGRCAIGTFLVAASAQGVCGIFFGEDPEELIEELHRRLPGASLTQGDAGFGRLMAEVTSFVEAPSPAPDFPLDLRGTPFQQRVWQALQTIPPGETASYADIAQRIGAPRSVRAVARACAANPVAVAVPCHRVVRANGGLSGYRWGIERKRALLERERTAAWHESRVLPA